MTISNKLKSKRFVHIALGCLWLLDGALQLQHQMFTGAFASQVIDPATQGQPLFVSGPTHFFVRIFLLHPAVFNSLVALIQLGIGVAILWKRTTKWGLLASVVWGSFVWAIGEGYGGIFSHQTSLIMGAPGAALIYVLLALASLPSATPKDAKPKDRAIIARQPVAYWLILVWSLVWLGGVYWQLTATGMNTVWGQISMFLGNSQGAPTWLAYIDVHMGVLINYFGGAYGNQTATSMHMSMSQMAEMPIKTSTVNWFTPTTVILMFFAAAGVYVKGLVRKVSIGIGIALSLLFWVTGQSLGGYYTGLATDPNTGPLLVLLGIAILGCTTLDTQLLRLVDSVANTVFGD